MQGVKVLRGKKYTEALETVFFSPKIKHAGNRCCFSGAPSEVIAPSEKAHAAENIKLDVYPKSKSTRKQVFQRQLKSEINITMLKCIFVF